MNNYPKLSTILIIFISITIVIGCAFYKTVREGLTNNDNVILLGDSILNNSNYVQADKSVVDILKSKLSKVINLAKDGATINDLYSQLDKIPVDLNKTDTYIFISAGGNDILNKRAQLNSGEITNLFNTYMDFLRALQVKLSSAKINLLTLYLPANPRYLGYKDSIIQWNQLINQNSSKVGQMYNVIDLYSLLTKPDDFVYDIEPSETASEKIANIIYFTR